MQQRRKLGSRRGEFMLEFALIFGIWMFMMIGAFDFGQFLFINQTLTERVRGAARYAAVKPGDTAGIQNFILYGQNPAPAGATGGDFGITTSNIAITVDPVGSYDARNISVKLSGYTYLVLSPYISGTYNGAPITATLPVQQ
jgi:Flp pilus assembly protein TadG